MMKSKDSIQNDIKASARKEELINRLISLYEKLPPESQRLLCAKVATQLREVDEEAQGTLA